MLRKSIADSADAAILNNARALESKSQIGACTVVYVAQIARQIFPRKNTAKTAAIGFGPIFLSATANKLTKLRFPLRLKYDICMLTQRFTKASARVTRFRGRRHFRGRIDFPFALEFMHRQSYAMKEGPFY